jgi:hypothetical protein
MKKWFIAASIVAVGAVVLFQGRASATPHCKNVRLTVTTAVDPQACASPVGLCTSGSIRQGGSEWATTHYVASSVGGSAVTTDMSYAGAMTVTRSNGTLVLGDSGLVNLADGMYTEYMRVISGTGAFAGATGTLFSNGYVVGTLQGFDGTLTGELCLAGNHGNDGLDDNNHDDD